MELRKHICLRRCRCSSELFCQLPYSGPTKGKGWVGREPVVAPDTISSCWLRWLSGAIASKLDGPNNCKVSRFTQRHLTAVIVHQSELLAQLRCQHVILRLVIQQCPAWVAPVFRYRCLPKQRGCNVKPVHRDVSLGVGEWCKRLHFLWCNSFVLVIITVLDARAASDEINIYIPQHGRVAPRYIPPDFSKETYRRGQQPTGIGGAEMWTWHRRKAIVPV